MRLLERNMENQIKLNAFFLPQYCSKLLSLSLVLLIAGCANTYSSRTPTQEEVKVRPIVTETAPLTSQQDIEIHAEQVNQSLEELYAVERAKKAENLVIKATPMLGPAHPSLRQPLSIDWSGPAEPLLAEIALRTHYRLKIMGNPPAIPMLVSINVRQVPAQDVLQNIRSQIYERGDLLLFPEQRVMELHYLD